MKKNILMAVAALALMACGNKSEKGADANEADSTAVEQTAESTADEASTEDASTDEAPAAGTSLLGSKSWPVKGEVSVKNFCRALLPGYHSFYAEDPANVERFFGDDEGEMVIDEKNGYLCFFQEGAGSVRIEVVYWKRKDGSIMVGFNSEEHSWDPQQDAIVLTTQQQFFVYDKEASQLAPIALPFNVKAPQGQVLCCQLPQKGRDIYYGFAPAHTKDGGYEVNWKLLKFNGMTFE